MVAAGCVSTVVRPPPTLQGVKRLAESGYRPLALSVAAEGVSGTAGHQFLLFVLPFGKISVPEAEQWVYDAAYLELAKRGYRPLPKTSATRSLPELRLGLEALDLSAYDLLIMRRLHCRVRLAATLYGVDGAPLRHYSTESSESSFKRYGFEPQLKEILGRALDGALRTALSEIRL